MSLAPDLLAAAALAAAGQQYPAGCLYVVATPIGNLADLSFRALHVLGLVDAVACEDTRVSAQLLKAFGLHKPLLALHEHNEREAAETVVERLRRGERVALISDAGTPAISDPGARLVQRLQAEGLRAVPIPGACSAAAAVSVAGDALSQGFAFVGFLPPKGEARKAALALPAQARTQVLFEAPHRVAQLVDELAALVPNQRLTMARELTKQFEQVLSLPAADWPERLRQLEAEGALRGEFVWLLHAAAPAHDEQALPAAAEQALKLLLPLLPLKQAVQLATELSGAPRNALYERALQLKNGEA